MVERVIEVISVTSAPNWWVSFDDVKGFKPLACWALSLKLDDQYPSLPPEKVVVGVTAEELDFLAGLELKGRAYYHDSEFWKPGEELK